MSANGAAAAKRRGRPRSERARLAILEAATELVLEHGLAGATMDAVAERAGVSKATIYRWWPTKETLALDAIYFSWAEATPHQPDTGSLRDDLIAILLPWARRLRSRPYGRVIAALITEAQNDPAFADQYRARFVEPRREHARVALARAAAGGVIPTDTDLEVAVDMLYGPVYHRLLHQHARVTDRFVTQVIDTVIRGLTT